MRSGIPGRAGTQPGLLEVDVPVGSSVVGDELDRLLRAPAALSVRVQVTISSQRGGCSA